MLLFCYYEAITVILVYHFVISLIYTGIRCGGEQIRRNYPNWRLYPTSTIITTISTATSITIQIILQQKYVMSVHRGTFIVYY